MKKRQISVSRMEWLETHPERDSLWEREGPTRYHSGALPTLTDQRELFAQLTAFWLIPYRAQRTHWIQAK